MLRRYDVGMPRVLLAFEPPDGGVAENVVQLTLGLPTAGWEVVLAGPRESPVFDRAASTGVEAHRLSFVRGYGSPRQDAAALAQLVRLIRQTKPEVVHCHSAKAGVVGRIAARIAGVKAVYSPHCLPFVGEFGAPRRIFATMTERALAPSTAAIVCVSEDERRRAERAGLGAQRLHVVRNGTASCDDDVEPNPALLALRRDGPVAAAVSVLRRQKRLDVFLDAVPTVLARVPDARLAVVGDGPLREELQLHAARLGLDAEPRFTFLPFEAPAARHLRAIDLYVLSSSWESMPIGVLEALACGVPQVVTDVGGTGEAISADTGLLVAPEDPAALARAIVELLEDAPRRERMSQASVRRHDELFGVQRMVEETAAIYRAVATRA
jgi:glycosyltransferase involved in cell wall biosynthesis